MDQVKPLLTCSNLPWAFKPSNKIPLDPLSLERSLISYSLYPSFIPTSSSNPSKSFVSNIVNILMQIELLAICQIQVSFTMSWTPHISFMARSTLVVQPTAMHVTCIQDRVVSSMVVSVAETHDKIADCSSEKFYWSFLFLSVELQVSVEAITVLFRSCFQMKHGDLSLVNWSEQ